MIQNKINNICSGDLNFFLLFAELTGLLVALRVPGSLTCGTGVLCSSAGLMWQEGRALACEASAEPVPQARSESERAVTLQATSATSCLLTCSCFVGPTGHPYPSFSVPSARRGLVTLQDVRAPQGLSLSHTLLWPQNSTCAQRKAEQHWYEIFPRYPVPFLYLIIHYMGLDDGTVW